MCVAPLRSGTERRAWFQVVKLSCESVSPASMGDLLHCRFWQHHIDLPNDSLRDTGRHQRPGLHVVFALADSAEGGV